MKASTAVTQEINELRSGLSDKVSISKVYRIKSNFGDFYQGLNDGHAHNGSIMALIAFGNESDGLDWRFVEKK